MWKELRIQAADTVITCQSKPKCDTIYILSRSVLEINVTKKAVGYQMIKHWAYCSYTYNKYWEPGYRNRCWFVSSNSLRRTLNNLQWPPISASDIGDGITVPWRRYCSRRTYWYLNEVDHPNAVLFPILVAVLFLRVFYYFPTAAQL